MDRIVKISEHQIPLFGSIIESEQVTLWTEIENLSTEIKTLQNLLRTKQKQYSDNDTILLELGLTNVANGFIFPEDFLTLPSTFKEKSLKTQQVEYSNYKPDLSSWKKVVYVLNKENRVLTGREIIEVIYNLEPELRNVPDEMRKKFEVNIFAILSNNTKLLKIVRFKHKGEYKYGFKNWFEDSGEIKKEYLV